jgi:hypothetical protein
MACLGGVVAAGRSGLTLCRTMPAVAANQWDTVVLFDMQNRKCGPYFATMNRILASAMSGAWPHSMMSCHGPDALVQAATLMRVCLGHDGMASSCGLVENGRCEAAFASTGFQFRRGSNHALLLQLAALTRLRSLDVGDCLSVTCTGLERLLRGCSGLEQLSLNGAHSIRDRGVAAVSRLPALSSLNLAGCRGITDVGVAELGACSVLRTLCLANTKVGWLLPCLQPQPCVAMAVRPAFH